MQYVRFFTFVVALASGFTSCLNLGTDEGQKEKQETKVAATGHPSWSLQSNVYEVNLRQYTTSASFNEFAASLPRLKEMGVEILWFMPITPISKTDRKGTLGSYYAVQNYTGINPEYGTLDDWKALVKKAHELGFKVITDWVANHTGADHAWLSTHPNFYNNDSTGKAKYAFDWSDTRDLNFDNKEMRDSMILAMKYWITETDIDGFRCDVAGEVPTDFWQQCIPELRKLKHVFMLAEADKPDIISAGFDATYTWSIFNVLFNIYAKRATVNDLSRTIDSLERVLPPEAMRLYFTTNHDENSWNGTEYERFGEAYKTMAVFTQTMYRSLPLIYSGQEDGNKKRIQFFEKDPIAWTGKYELSGFYKTLLMLRKNNPALAADASFKKINTGDSSAIYAFVREKENKKILVVLNLSSKPQSLKIADTSLASMAVNVFSGKPETASVINIEPWGHRVYEYQK
jgi:alpha-amylase